MLFVDLLILLVLGFLFVAFRLGCGASHGAAADAAASSVLVARSSRVIFLSSWAN